MTKNAVVLLSGGLDSTTTLAIAQDQGFEPCALSFRYGQRHHVELDAAKQHRCARRRGRSTSRPKSTCACSAVRPSLMRSTCLRAAKPRR